MSFQCVDTVGWVTGRASGLWNLCNLSPKIHSWNRRKMKTKGKEPVIQVHLES